MTKTHKAIVDNFPCPTCDARIGKECLSDKGHGEVMSRSVHPKRMICPICSQYYDERSGSGFRHFNGGSNDWCRLKGGA